MTTEADTEVQRILIADYNLTKFPEYQDEATEMGQAKVAAVYDATRRLIASAFQDVFRKNWDDRMYPDCRRVRQVDGDGNESNMIMHGNIPFLMLGELYEAFAFDDGADHLLIYQTYKVLA